MDNKITLNYNDGSSKEAELMRVFENIEKTKKYLVYTFNEIDDNNLLKIYVSEIQSANGENRLVNIATEEEWTKIKELFRDLITGGAQNA